MARAAFFANLGTQKGNGIFPVQTGAIQDPVTQGNDAQTDIATAITDYTAAVGASTGDSLKQLLNNQTYSATTLQLSGTPGSSVTLTVAQQEGLITLINTLGTALLTVQSDLAGAGQTPNVLVSVDLAKATASGVTAAFDKLNRVIAASDSIAE
jgi:hypothetical protein